MDAKLIGARIKEARIAKGISDYRALAKRLTQRKNGGAIVGELSDEAVRLWEVGKKIPPYEKIEQLSQVLGEPEEWLLFGIRRDEQSRRERRYLEWISDEEMSLLTQFRQTNRTGQSLVADNAVAMAKKFPAARTELRTRQVSATK